MKHRWLFWVAVALVAFGGIGFALSSVTASRTNPSTNSGSASTGGPRLGGRGQGRGPVQPGAPISDLGVRIFTTGVGENGPIPRSAVGPGMMGVGCAYCHGADGRGRTVSVMMRTVEAPDIRLSALMSKTDERWTRESVARAIEDGVDPNGDPLDEFMPRWRMNNTEVTAVIDYLEELSR